MNQRLREFIEYKGLTVRGFEKRIGVANGYVRGVKDVIGDRILADIRKRFPELNVNWLLDGEGDMLNPAPAHVYNANVNTGNMSAGNMAIAGGTINGTINGGPTGTGDVTACLEIIKGMQEQILTLQRQLEESHCKVADLMMQALAKRE